MHESAKTAFCGLYKYSGFMSVQETLSRWSRGPFLSIVLFHKVTDAIPEDDLTICPTRFEQMCRMLKKHFRVVPLAEIFRIVRTCEPFPARTVAITFDDGYRDNLFAARTLARHELPACFFVSTAYMGTCDKFAWDKDVPPLAKLTWDEVREMDGMGHEIGSHTHTHPDLGIVSLDTVRYELRESKRVLEEELGHKIRWFSYPFGERHQFPADRLPLVAEAGYEGCVSAFGGFIHPGADSRMLPRETVPSYSSLTLEVRLSGCLNWLYGLREFLKTRPHLLPTGAGAAGDRHELKPEHEPRLTSST